MKPTRKQVLDAWRAWDAGLTMTPEQQAMLLTDETGRRIIPDDPHEARTKALARDGHKPVTRQALAELLEGQTEIVAEQLRAMRRRIEALEAEVRAGHARLTALETAQEAQEAWNDDDL